MVNKLRVLVYLYRDDITRALIFFLQAIICNLLLCSYYHEKGKSESISHSVVDNSLPPHVLEPTRPFCPWNSSAKNMGVGCHFLYQEIFPTKELNLGLLPWRWIFNYLSHQGSPITLILHRYPYNQESLCIRRHVLQTA